MEELKTKAEKLTTHVGDLLDTYYQLTVANLTQKAARTAGGAFIFIISCFIALCIMVFIGIGLSIWVGDLVNNAAAGYFIVAGFYLLLLAIFYGLRKKIFLPFIRNFIVRKIYD
jgi:hypothetical protein